MSNTIEAESQAASRESAARDDCLGQYLTFRIAGDLYGIDILRVQEIRSWDHVTKVPNTADYVLGVLNIRGTIIPIIDLKLRFHLGQTSIALTTVVVVVKAFHEGGERTMGLLVDAVSDVFDVSQGNLKDAPKLATGGLESRFILGLSSRTREDDTGDDNQEMVTLLDIDSLLNSEEMCPQESKRG